jgi:hypothetical protein
MARLLTVEDRRLQEDKARTKYWKRWGSYLSERQWGTVREDYSPGGTAWEYLPHDNARSRTYRWGEDGIGGISDRHQLICFALALWNGRDPILKERLFGLNGHEGNHGEDVKEYYFYLDATPTHSYMKMLYKYPQAEFPYDQLVAENERRGRRESEYELIDTGVFAENRYFDVFVEYAKADVEDIVIKITAINRGPDEAPLHLLPSLWFRNTWSWGRDDRRPTITPISALSGNTCLEIQHWQYGKRWLIAEGSPQLLFTDNDTNTQRLFNMPNQGYVKDAFHEYLVHGNKAAVNPTPTGTKMAALHSTILKSGASITLKLRLTDRDPSATANSGATANAGSQAKQGNGNSSAVPTADEPPALGDFGAGFESVFTARVKDADDFYATKTPPELSEDGKMIMRQAFGGMLWCKQFYHYDVRHWLDGDPASPPPPKERLQGRNKDWTHLYNDDIITMPDKWEYPWYAAWDLAFHCIPISLIDPDFAKEQLILLLREWYMHPNGQLPAYEWAFGDVNPPVHAWAAFRVYKIERRVRGVADRGFLEKVFHKLLLNFTWWVNRKDPD